MKGGRRKEKQIKSNFFVDEFIGAWESAYMQNMTGNIDIQVNDKRLSDGSTVWSVIVNKREEYDHNCQRLEFDAMDYKHAIRASKAIRDAINSATTL